MRTEKKTANTKKVVFITLGVVLLAALVFAILEKTRVTNFVSLAPTAEKAQTTSTAPSAQESFDQGGDRTPATSTRNEGSASDTGSVTGSLPPESQWTRSSSGVITAYSPAANEVVTSGASFSGASTADTVYFRLIDTASGVIAQGPLSVVDGTFSGKLQFSTTAADGRLDLYTATADGVESNNIEIPIRFR